MPEYHHHEGGAAALAFQALLYASGEMTETEAAGFEARLGEDQAAREALCGAVQLVCAQSGLAALRPDPAYREQVRLRVQPRRGFWRWLTGKGFYHGHPLAWIGLGAAAAVLVMVSLDGRWPSGSSAPSRAVLAARPGKVETPRRPKRAAPAPEQPAATSTAEAKAWAELHASLAWRKRLLTHPGVKH